MEKIKLIVEIEKLENTSEDEMRELVAEAVDNHFVSVWYKVSIAPKDNNNSCCG